MLSAPSDSAIDYQSIFEWTLVALTLLGLLYSAFVIKNEKKNYLSESKLIKFQSFNLQIPRWWSFSTLSETKILLKRSDTHYDWRAIFELKESNLGLENYLDNYLKEHEIELDNSYGSYEKITNAAYLFQDECLLKEAFEFVRVESIGTEKSEKRIYLDLVLLKLKNEKNRTYIFESKSSVLNGCVEGPYFEECLKIATLYV